MWFKQLQLFRLTPQKFDIEAIKEKLEQLSFQPCLPSMPYSSGWASPVDEEEAPILRAVNGYIMLCMQTEEKILPATVVRQELNNKVKKIELAQDRKVRQKEKLTLKDEITFTLLPRAFTKISRIYAYIDTKNHWFVIGSTSAAKNEQLLTLFKRTITEDIHTLDLTKPSSILTHWLKTQKYPDVFAIENSGVLQDINQQKRVIRCQHQDLFVPSIQSFIKDGCEARQLGLSWHDRVKFTLADDFTLRSIQYDDDILTQANDVGETAQQRFDADLLIMTETLSSLLKDLVPLFEKQNEKEKAGELEVA